MADQFRLGDAPNRRARRWVYLRWAARQGWRSVDRAVLGLIVFGFATISLERWWTDNPWLIFGGGVAAAFAAGFGSALHQAPFHFLEERVVQETNAAIEHQRAADAALVARAQQERDDAVRAARELRLRADLNYVIHEGRIPETWFAVGASRIEHIPRMGNLTAGPRISLQGWIAKAQNVLRAAGLESEARALSLTDDDDLGTNESYKAAYEKRLQLIREWAARPPL